MAEAIGIVSLGIQVCQGLLKYYGSWKDGRKDVAALCSSLESLSSILDRLEHTLTGTIEDKSTINDCIEACRSSIEQLDKKLSKVQSVANPGKLTAKIHDQGRRLLYPFRESTLVKLKEIVADIRSNLALAVNATQLQASLTISDQVRDMAAFVVDRDRVSERMAPENGSLLLMSFRIGFLERRKLCGVGGNVRSIPPTSGQRCGADMNEAGAGKTVLASSMIDRLKTRYLSSTDALAFVYCSYKDRFSQTLVALVSSLVQQVVRCCPSIPEPIRALYSQHQARNTRPTVAEYSIMLRDIVTIFPRTYFVIDALDECQEIDETRSKFTKLLLDLPTNVHLLCTSRKLGDISDSFSSAPRLEIVGSNGDIELFLTGQISSNRRLQSFCETSPDLKRTILDKVISNAKGMFLLAKLHIQSLKTKTSSKQVTKALEKLPAQLGTVYREAIQRIEGQHEEEAQLAMRLLSWITHSYRPLKVEELQHAMAVMDFEPDDKSISEEDLPAESMMITVCGGLAVVDPRSRIVRLVHYTTEEYFDRHRNDLFPDASVEIARSCVRYLSMDVFTHTECRRYEDMKRRRERYKLLKYASINWGNHAAGCVELQIIDDILALLKDGALLSTLNHTIYNSKDDIAGLGLLTAARCGLDATVNALLTSGVDINARGRRRQTALHEASSNGHQHLIQLLLKKGAKLEAKDDNGDTPFLLAIGAGHERIVQQLLNAERTFDKDLSTSYEIYGIDFDFNTALHKAVQQGSETTITMLLDHGAIINAENIRKETPLFLAVGTGNVQVVKCLLRRGARADCWDKTWKTPLWWAVEYGDEIIIRLLCNYGANIELELEDGMSPLHLALERAQWRIISLLLDSQSKYHVGKPETLHKAARSGHLKGLRLLLDNGTDINSRHFWGETFLFRAAESDHVELMHTFIAYNGDIEARDEMGRTALHMAVRHDWPGVQSLISIGAATDTQDDAGNSPLSDALLGSRHQSVIEALLQHRNPRVLNTSEMNSLHRFLDQTRGLVHPIFKLLIENDVKIRNTELVTKAFLQAVERGLLQDVEFFLEAGVDDIEARGEDGKTALQIASERSSEEHGEIIGLLVENAASIDAVNPERREFVLRQVHRRYEADSFMLQSKSGMDTKPMLILEGPEPIGSHMTTLPSTHLSFARQLGLDF